LPFPASEGMELVPSADAKALVSYLLSLKKDQKVPAVLDFAPAKKKG
jgi:cytochrome c oxidase cbb3-type subunit II